VPDAGGRRDERLALMLYYARYYSNTLEIACTADLALPADANVYLSFEIQSARGHRGPLFRQWVRFRQLGVAHPGRAASFEPQ
jgi:hypothetical protein